MLSFEEFFKDNIKLNNDKNIIYNYIKLEDDKFMVFTYDIYCWSSAYIFRVVIFKNINDCYVLINKYDHDFSYGFFIDYFHDEEFKNLDVGILYLHSVDLKNNIINFKTYGNSYNPDFKCIIIKFNFIENKFIYEKNKINYHEHYYSNNYDIIRLNLDDYIHFHKVYYKNILKFSFKHHTSNIYIFHNSINNLNYFKNTNIIILEYEKILKYIILDDWKPSNNYLFSKKQKEIVFNIMYIKEKLNLNFDIVLEIIKKIFYIPMYIEDIDKYSIDYS